MKFWLKLYVMMVYIKFFIFLNRSEEKFMNVLINNAYLNIMYKFRVVKNLDQLKNNDVFNQKCFWKYLKPISSRQSWIEAYSAKFFSVLNKCIIPKMR